MAVITGLAIFFVCTQRSIEKNSQNTMMNTVTRQSEHLNSILKIHYQYLNGIAKELGKSDELITDDNMEMLSALRNYTDLEHTALILLDGTAYYDNGIIKNVSKRSYFTEAIKGNQVLSDPLISSVDEETRVILGVPILKNNKVKAILGGSYNVTTLSRSMFNDAFGGVGYSLIISKEGNIIAHDGDKDYQTIQYGENFFDFYNGKTLLNGDSFSNVKKDFNAHRSGLIKMRTTNGKQSEQYLAYAPLGMNDWMICYVLPVSDAQKPYNFLKSYETIFSGCFCVLVVLLILYILHKNYIRNQELLHSAQTDALTGLYNKKATEEFINEALKTDRGKLMQVFLILDMDRFKHINDTYGHAFGDVVIQQFGALLRKHFRGHDIVGRIGGDEFVVFMQDLESADTVYTRVEHLIEKIHSLEFPDFKEELSASIGIAFAPKDGDCYMDLYKCADTALYQTKQNGKDGYRVYEKV